MDLPAHVSQTKVPTAMDTQIHVSQTEVPNRNGTVSRCISNHEQLLEITLAKNQFFPNQKLLKLFEVYTSILKPRLFFVKDSLW